jgi:hypothetical protein
MAKDDKVLNESDQKFNFGVGEQRRAGAGAAQDLSVQGLSLDSARRKTATETAGSDPYNTSGSFDRKKHWARVGKR